MLYGETEEKQASGCYVTLSGRNTPEKHSILKVFPIRLKKKTKQPNK